MPNIIVGVKVASEEAKAKLQDLIKTTNAASSRGGALGGVLSGIGAGVGIAGVVGVTSAVSTLTNILGDAVAAAREDEVSVRQLGVALRDNVPAWDGQTGAIERTILARQRLGFEDTALRGSLATLAAATRDVNRALELQQLAMDIARFRGIDLATASDMVAKASAGSLKALNAAIPATRGAANAQEALTRAIEATAGQAEAYADTSLGKMDAAAIRTGESMERLGARIMPVVADATDLAAGAVDLLTTAIDGLTTPLRTAEAKSWDTGEAVQTVGYQAGWAAAQVNGLVAPAAAAAGQLDSLSGAAINLKYNAINAASGILDLAAANATLSESWRVNAATGFTITGTYEQYRESLQRSRAAQMDWIVQITRTTKALGGGGGGGGGATRATQDFASAVGKAFDALRTKVTRAFDAIHEKNLRYIEDARQAANAPYTAQIEALTAEITAMEAELEAKRNAARLAELERAVTEAQTTEERAAAEEALADYKAQLAIEAKRDELAKAEAAVEANDKIAADAAKAEEERDKKQRDNFERELKALETHLTNKETTWKKANADLLKLLDKYDLDFEAVGKKMGTAYATGYTKGVNSALKSIAAAVAKLLGLDEATIKQLATGTAAAGTTTAAAGATAATGGATATPTTSTTTSTAPSSGAGAGGSSLVFNVTINAGAFTGTQADAKKFAADMWTYFYNETDRRQREWPPKSTSPGA